MTVAESKAVEYAGYTFDDLSEMTEDERKKKTDGLIYNTERLLCVAEGSLREWMLPLFAR